MVYSFRTEGADWKHSRGVLRKQLCARIHYQNLDPFRDHVDNLIERLPKRSGTVDLQAFFFNLTLDTTASLLLGKSAHTLKSEAATDIKAFQESFNAAQEGLAKRFRIAPWHFLYNPSSFRGPSTNSLITISKRGIEGSVRGIITAGHMALSINSPRSLALHNRFEISY